METIDSLSTEQLEIGDTVSFLDEDGPDTIEIKEKHDEIDTFRVIGVSLVSGDWVDKDFLPDHRFDLMGA